jgi:hypothetical protein
MDEQLQLEQSLIEEFSLMDVTWFPRIERVMKLRFTFSGRTDPETALGLLLLLVCRMSRLRNPDYNGAVLFVVDLLELGARYATGEKLHDIEKINGREVYNCVGNLNLEQRKLLLKWHTLQMLAVGLPDDEDGYEWGEVNPLVVEQWLARTVGT